MKILKPYYDLKKWYRHYCEISALYEEQRLKNAGKQVQYWNWWEDERTAYWLEKFMESRGLLKGTDKTIALCSVFGEREVLERVNADVKIFFSGENLHHNRNAAYADYMLSGKKPFDFAMGFDDFKKESYMRFPLWLTYMFEPRMDEQMIRERCEQLRHPDIGHRDRFACLIARADISGVRTAMYEGLIEVGKVDCPSVLFHNDDSLKEQFDDDKVAYMRQYRFNICPENSNADGYCTEKVFEAIVAGCIPVYWGSNNMPELKVINQDAIVLWNKESNGAAAIAQIRELCADKKKLDAFMRQPRLTPDALEIIIEKFDMLEQQLRKLLL